MHTASDSESERRIEREDPAYAKRIALAVVALVAIAVILMGLVKP